MNLSVIIGILIPFFGTMLGSACVYLLKDKMKHNWKKFLLGFASGVMLAASVWSLLIPALDLSKEERLIPWIPAASGFILGLSLIHI